MKLLAAPLLLLLAATPGRAAQDLAALLPRDPALVIGARVRALLDSDLMRTQGSQTLGLVANWRQLSGGLLFDPLRDVDEFIAAARTAGENPPFVVAVRGRFPAPQIAAGRASYKGVALGTAGSGTVIAILDTETALVGDGAEVRAAIDRRDSARPPSPAAERIAGLHARYDLWGFGRKPSGFVPSKSAPGGLDGVDRFEFGLTWSRGLELTADLHFSDLKAAAELSLGFGQLQQIVASQSSSSNVRMEAKMEEETLHFAMFVPEEELKKALVARTLAPAPAAQAGPQPTLRPTARPAALPLVISAPVGAPAAADAPAVFKLPGGR